MRLLIARNQCATIVINSFLEKFAEQGIKPEMLGVSYAMAEKHLRCHSNGTQSTAILDVVDGHILVSQKIAQPVTANHPNAATKVSCGRPIAGTAVKIVDDAGAEVAERHVGHIWVQSDCMLTEYYKRPDLQPFQDGWYATGDMGYLADGNCM